jgi:hypothetical protein
VLNGGRSVSFLVRDDGQVVVRSGMARIDLHPALKEFPRLGRSPRRPVNEHKVHNRLHVSRLCG